MGVLKVVEPEQSSAAKIARQVECLQKAIETAKAGKFDTLMIIAMEHEEMTLVRWTECENLVLLLGMIYRLGHVVNKRLDGDV